MILLNVVISFEILITRNTYIADMDVIKRVICYFR